MLARIPSFLVAVLLAGCGATLRGAGPEARAPVAAPAPAADPVPRALPSHAGQPSPSPPPPAAVRTLARATIGAVGDVLMHEAVKRSAETHGRGDPDGGYGWLFAPVADLLAQPDVAFANLETPVAPDASAGTRPFVFNAPPAVLGALRRAGVDAVAVANNHAFDQGRAGFEETLLRLEQAGLRAVGLAAAGGGAAPVRIEAGGLTLALLGYAHFFNQDGNACPRGAEGACAQAAQLERARILADVRAAALAADAVIVSLHWGVEYAPEPRAEDVELAHEILAAGALVVLGHHPHVLQPIELHRGPDGRAGLVAYSLGNFVSNQSRRYVHGVTPDRVAATRDGALLRVGIAKRDYGGGVVRVELDGADFLPLWTENDTAEIDRRREPERRPAIRVVAIDRAVAEVRSELARFPDPVPPADRDRFVALRRREALLLSRRAAIAGVLGEELLGTAPVRAEGPPAEGRAAALAPAAGTSGDPFAPATPAGPR